MESGYVTAIPNVVVDRENVNCVLLEVYLVLMWYRRCSWYCCWIVCMWSSVVLCHRRCDIQSPVCKRFSIISAYSGTY